ncbi:nitroreductase family deazaflavin-dependent oxidoreductase [Fodinicola acaciae]|uniref:nitroreductase family deazaflavin-dependent oxidoreductase n=1 Tax=Fodinicola acaciae TaxID=2681555 RepID=UPI001FE4809D|nr:nitroreductase family deazaflavin-dependent oxidoreductase [Fodinicola acaciae]
MDMKTFNRDLIAEFRANDGKLSGQFANSTLVLLTTTGAKSGRPHTVPLGWVADGSEDRIVLFASNIGAPKHPAWYLNLVANPDVTIELRGETFAGKASSLTDGGEYERLYELFTSQMPGTETHQSKTERKIPMVLVERVRM